MGNSSRTCNGDWTPLFRPETKRFIDRRRWMWSKKAVFSMEKKMNNSQAKSRFAWDKKHMKHISKHGFGGLFEAERSNGTTHESILSKYWASSRVKHVSRRIMISLMLFGTVHVYFQLEILAVSHVTKRMYDRWLIFSSSLSLSSAGSKHGEQIRANHAFSLLPMTEHYLCIIL